MTALSGRPRITVAVVSYNTRDFLVRCLRSLHGPVSAGQAQVWVIDNASSDGSAAAARETAPWAEVHETGENLGFGRAVNRVAASTQSEWLACANADVALEPGALDALLARAADPSVACLAPRLVLPDGTSQSSLHNLPTLGFSLAVSLGVYRLAPAVADRMLMPGRYDLDRPREVPWAVGAFLLVRRDAFDRIGGFDEQLWMYAEDLDLGWRLREAGFRTLYVPEARVLHHGAAATEPVFGANPAPQFMRSTYDVLRRRRGRLRAGLTALVNLAGAGLRIAWMAPLAVFVPRLRRPTVEARVWFRAHGQGLRLLWGR